MDGFKDSLKTLSNITRILQRSDPSENPLAHIAQIVRQKLEVDVTSIYLLQNKTLVLVATDGLDPNSIGRVRMGVHEGLTGLAVEKLQPVIVNEASLHPRFKFFPETGEEKFNSFIAVPLIEQKEVIGVLTLQTTDRREFQIEEIEMLKIIAFQLSGVIKNVMTLEMLTQVEKGAQHSLVLEGIGVASGIGMGAAFFLRPGVDPVIPSLSQEPLGSKNQEWKKLQKALSQALSDLEKLEKKLLKKFSKNESDIFYSHRMILSDESFQKKLKAEIEKGRSSFDAVNEIIGSYIQHFEKIEDPHFRERAADLEDLRQRVLEHLIEKKRGRKKSFKMEGVLVADTLVPSDTAVLDPECIQAIVTARGGLTSHAAILARSMGIPAVMGVAGLLSKIKPGDLLIVDGQAGKVFLNPERKILLEYEKQQERLADEILKLQAYAAQPAQTLDGHSIKVMANVGIASDLKKLPYYGAEGVGLYRTEFPFVSRKTLPNEEEQFHLYRQVIEEAKGLPVTFRILDAGGDKPIEGLGIPVEANPFLGYRSIRLFFKRPEILEIQFRALLRASTSGPISILVPMITGLEDIRVVKAILEKSKQDLKRQKISFDSHIPLGIMIEVPSAVQLSHLLIQEADYFSIGTNDLIQYTLAVDRNNERVASFFEPLHPAVLASIARVAEVARNAKKSVGICGEIAGNSELAPLFVGFGINHLSMMVTNIPSLKKTIREMNYEKAKVLAEKVLREDTVEGVKVLLHDYWEK